MPREIRANERRRRPVVIRPALWGVGKAGTRMERRPTATTLNRSRPSPHRRDVPGRGETMVEREPTNERREQVQLWIALLGALALVVIRVALAAGS